MTVIVWDGKTLAADRMTVICDMGFTVSKMMQRSGYTFACTGDLDRFAPLVEWFCNGADPQRFAAIQDAKDDNDFTRLIVASEQGCIYYERKPYPIYVLDPFLAWGSGRDFAMGALAMGADARRAVEIASRHSITCGLGIEAYDVIQTEQTRYPFGSCGEY